MFHSSKQNCKFKAVTGIYSLANFVIFHSSEQIAETQVGKQLASNQGTAKIGSIHGVLESQASMGSAVQFHKQAWLMWNQVMSSSQTGWAITENSSFIKSFLEGYGILVQLEVGPCVDRSKESEISMSLKVQPEHEPLANKKGHLFLI